MPYSLPNPLVRQYTLQLTKKQRLQCTARDLFEFARFVICCSLTPGGSAVLSPPARIDEIWHCALLFSAPYGRLSAALGGDKGLIDHHPLRAYEGGEERAARRARAHTAYAGIFGEQPPPECWSDELERSSGGSE